MIEILKIALSARISQINHKNKNINNLLKVVTKTSDISSPPKTPWHSFK